MSSRPYATTARAVFDAIIDGDGDVYAVHKGERIKLKSVALADGKLVGIASTASGGLKTVDITNDEVLRVTTEVIATGRASDANDDEEENE